MMTPATPSAATARTWSRAPMPPEAITGTPPAALATARVRGDARRGADGGHKIGLHRPPGARAVQVDDVEPACPRGREAARHRDRVVAVHRLALEGPLEQSDATAAAEIDRGVDDHASWRTKLSSSRRPTCWLFSGWN